MRTRLRGSLYDASLEHGVEQCALEDLPRDDERWHSEHDAIPNAIILNIHDAPRRELVELRQTRQIMGRDLDREVVAIQIFKEILFH